MKATTEMVLTDNLKALNLSHMAPPGTTGPSGLGTGDRVWRIYIMIQIKAR